jgi:hypothetical protein
MGALSETLWFEFKWFFNIKRMLPAASGILTSIHEKVLTTVGTSLPSNTSSMSTIHTLKELELPDFSKLSWRDILNLRYDDFVNEFRQKLAKLTEEFYHDGDIDRAKKQIMNDIWNLISDVRPNVKRTILDGILGNLPFPFIINPLSLASSANAIESQQNLKREYGWLFFIQKAKEASQKAKEA